MKEKVVNMLIVAFICVTLLNPADAVHNLNSSTHRHYIAKTYASAPASATHTAKNEQIEGVSVYISKINNGDDEESDYKYIRMYLYGGTADTDWVSDSVTNQTCFLSGFGTREARVKLTKTHYYEFYTGESCNNNLVMTFYGNSTSADAYAYIKEGFVDSVSTTN